MTTVVSLFGGPGTGKSTSAAYIFSQLKMRGHSAELVAEYAKTWAWQGRKIGPFDQFYLFGKQVHYESRLLGKVDFIVTDCPVAMGQIYARKYCAPAVALVIEDSTAVYLQEVRNVGHKHFNVQLLRSKPYIQAGRFETEADARDVDARVAQQIEFDIYCGTQTLHLDALVDAIVATP